MIVTITISDIETGGIDVNVKPSEEVKPETRSLALATSIFMLEKLKEAEQAAMNEPRIIKPEDGQK
jgi:hypothetical protein